MIINDNNVKRLFPILDSDIVYLDSAATAQKPACVVDAIADFYLKNNANPMRGLYDLSLSATDAYENARSEVSKFINAAGSSEVIFTRNASESLNLAATVLGERYLSEGDEVLVSVVEHHSNFLPWKKAAEKNGASVRYFDCEKDGTLTPEMLKNTLTPRTKIFSVTQVSNVFGRENPIKEFAKICHENGTLIVVDAAQSVPHIPVDVRDLDADMLAFSGHKLYGPMGIGVLYGKRKILEDVGPFLLGGEMIDFVSKDRTVYSEIPHKFEAGTVSAADAAGLAEAIRFVNGIGFEQIGSRELSLTARALEKIKNIPHINIIGSDKPEEHHGIITFTVDDVHPHDIAAIFAAENICVRAGHHCAQPLHIHLGIPSTARASIAFYNTESDIDRFVDTMSQIRSKMGYE